MSIFVRQDYLILPHFITEEIGRVVVYLTHRNTVQKGHKLI